MLKNKHLYGKIIEKCKKSLNNAKYANISNFTNLTRNSLNEQRPAQQDQPNQISAQLLKALFFLWFYSTSLKLRCI